MIINFNTVVDWSVRIIVFKISDRNKAMIFIYFSKINLILKLCCSFVKWTVGHTLVFYCKACLVNHQLV